MEMTVLVGDDTAVLARRAELLSGFGDTERIDAVEDEGAALVAAIGSPSLFGPRRVVILDSIDAVSDANWAQVESLAEHSDTVVVASAAKLDAATTKQLKGVAIVEKFAATTARNAKERITAAAAAAGITLDRRALAAIVSRAGTDMARATSVLAALSMGGFTNPSAAQVTVLLGTATPDEMPWTMSDALERGDLAAALDALDGLEPIPTVAYLTSKLTSASKAFEVGGDADAVAAALGVTPFAARSAVTLARRLGVDGIAESWKVLAPLDAAVKRLSSDPTAARIALGAALAELVALWSPRR